MSIVVILLLSTSTSVYLIGDTKPLLSEHKEMIKQTADYIKDHTSLNDKIISHGVFEISFYANRVHYNLEDLTGEDYAFFVNQLKDNTGNLCITLKQNNISYYLFYGHNYYPDFATLAYLYDSNLYNFDRTDLIKSKLKQQDPLEKYSKQKEVVDKYKIRECFRLEKEFGDYKIYKII